MSLNNSLAITRPHPSRETFNKLAQSHLQHDLTAEDRDALTAAGRTFGLYTTIGSVVGLGLGLVLAIRVRQGRRQMLTALRMTDRPTHVKFMDGREGELQSIYDSYINCFGCFCEGPSFNCKTKELLTLPFSLEFQISRSFTRSLPLPTSNTSR